MLRVRLMAAALSPQRQAVMWEVRLREGDADDAELSAFEGWRDATADNAQAWDALQERLARMGGGGSRASAAMAHALRVPSTERRRALRGAFALLALGVGAWGAREGALGLGLDADWRSPVGERGAGVLADGTPLAYDADSRIYLAGSAAAPLLDLRQGQLLLKATPQSAGILTVSTAHGAVVSRGAVLNVGRLRERSVVSVKAGSALLRPAGRAAVPIEAGQTFYFDRHGAMAPGPATCRSPPSVRGRAAFLSPTACRWRNCWMSSAAIVQDCCAPAVKPRPRRSAACSASMISTARCCRWPPRCPSS